MSGDARRYLHVFHVVLAQEVFPVIEIVVGRTVDVVVSRGVIVTAPTDVPEH
jgi:hypothetical protein